ncbi:MAG: MraY family glycosyltransferase [Candidatus Moranbacteria bacterium]|nr:MraY family glycosyltransferase [Candidatus Moranbacteria bacterium]
MFNIELYLKPFLFALAISSALIFFIIKMAEKRNFLIAKRKGERHIHDKRKKISRLGGAAIIAAFLAAIFLDENLVIAKEMWGMILGGIIILLVGLADDVKELGWKTQLIFQSFAASMIFIFGARINYITNPFGEIILFDTPEKVILGIFMGIVWSLILINSMNWLDGIDGLSGGVALVGAIAIFILSLKPEVNQPPVGIISIALSGSLLGFLIFNSYPAKIMAGTSGAFFMGFILAGISVFAGTKIATTLLVLAVPIIDFFWVIGRRIRLKKSIFEPDQEHLHHKLLGLGWSQREISLFFYSITALVAVVALSVGAVWKVAVISLLLVLSGAFFYAINNHKGEKA